MKLVLQQCALADRDHAQSARQYAHIFHKDGAICVAGAFFDLPGEHQCGILLHELGHALVPNEEDELEVDRVASRRFGVKISRRTTQHGERLEWIEPHDVARATMTLDKHIQAPARCNGARRNFVRTIFQQHLSVLASILLGEADANTCADFVVAVADFGYAPKWCEYVLGLLRHGHGPAPDHVALCNALDRYTPRPRPTHYPALTRDIIALFSAWNPTALQRFYRASDDSTRAALDIIFWAQLTVEDWSAVTREELSMPAEAAHKLVQIVPAPESREAGASWYWRHFTKLDTLQDWTRRTHLAFSTDFADVWASPVAHRSSASKKTLDVTWSNAADMYNTTFEARARYMRDPVRMAPRKEPYAVCAHEACRLSAAAVAYLRLSEVLPKTSPKAWDALFAPLVIRQAIDLSYTMLAKAVRYVEDIGSF